MQNNDLYLRDKTTNTIYSSVRDSNGNLVRIGHYDPTTFTIIASKRSEQSLGVAAAIYPFPVDPDDHCETPQLAYEHIVPVLSTLANALQLSTPDELKIWDPFYCAGGVANHLHTLGFPHVYNENEDFYAYDHGKTSGPKKYDVLITNPPYTAEHIPSLLEFCKTSGKPCLLLLPNYCLHKYEKQMRALTTGLGDDLFYVWSKSRYKYKSPKLARDKDKARKDRVTSPFVSFWFCYVPSTWKQQCNAGGFGPSLSTGMFSKEYAAKVQQAKATVPADMLTDHSRQGTNEQERARNLLKGRFDASSKTLPDFLLDRSKPQKGGGGSGGSGGNDGGSSGHSKKKKKGKKRGHHNQHRTKHFGNNKKPKKKE